MEHERQWALKMEHEKWKIGSKWKTRGGECAEVIAYCDALLCPLLMRIKDASFSEQQRWTLAGMHFGGQPECKIIKRID